MGAPHRPLPLVSLAFAALFAPVLLLAACGGDDDAAQDETSELPVAVLETRWATAEAASVVTLMENKGWAFIGEVTGLRETLAVDWVPDDDGPQATVPDKPVGDNTSPPTVPVSIFDLQVTDVIAGDLQPGQAITMQQTGGLHTQSTGEQILVVLGGDELLQPGERYLFFVSPGDTGHFITSPISRLHVAEDGSLQPPPEFASLGAMQELGGQSTSVAATLISEASPQ